MSENRASDRRTPEHRMPETPASLSENQLDPSSAETALSRGMSAGISAELPASSSDEEREAERSLRGLIGPGASQVSVTAAMRARDASRPSERDLAEAEERLVIVRRYWVPRDELPRSIVRPS